MENKGRRHGRLMIRGKFMVVLFPLMLASMFVMTALGIYYMRNSTRNALEESLTQAVEIAADRVSDRVSANVELAASIASNVGAAYTQYLSAPYEKASAAKLQLELTDMSERYGFLHIYAVDTDGYIRSEKHTDLKELGAEFLEAIEGGAEYYMTDPTPDSQKFEGKYTFNIAVPIKDKSENYIGTLVCKVDAGKLCDLVADISVGENGSTFIMDKNTRCISHKDQGMLYNGETFIAVRDNPDNATLNRLWDDMSAREKGYTKYDYNGTRLAAYTRIKDTDGWSLAVTVSEDEFMAQANSAVLTFIMISAALIAVCSVIISVFISHITKRIKGVTLSLEKLAQGELSTERIKVASFDEVGRLEAVSNKLQDDLHEVIDRIEASLDEIARGNLLITDREKLAGDFAAIDEAILVNKRKLSEMLSGLSRTANEVSHGSEQIANGAASLAQGAAEQASSVEELFTSVTDVSQKATALGGVRAVPDADEASDEDSLTHKLTLAMARISDASGSIRKIAANIDSISSETGMLALNASVEATHAGEFGKGFAVIAAEVRALSDKCRDAARSADAQIDSIFAAIDRGNRTVGWTVEAVGDMVISIEQFKNALEQISNVIESTAATAEESATSSEELSLQAGVLNDMISNFQYEKDSGEWGHGNG